MVSEKEDQQPHILALRHIAEELKNHDMEAVLTFIDFRKAFDCIDRNRMFQILQAYGIPPDVVAAISHVREHISSCYHT